MSRVSLMKKSEVGEVRPSQMLTTFGTGSLVDLPNMSVIVMGLDDWPISQGSEINEERLLYSAQAILGPQVRRLMTPPRGPESIGSQTNWFDESRQIGVPVAPFPRWMVCTKCRLLAPIKSGLFEAKVFPYRPDKACYVHNCTSQGRAPLAIPARFLVACERGHLDDFPWVDFMHPGGGECNGPLRMFEFGPSGEMADVTIACDGCQTKRRLSEVIGPMGIKKMPPCNGRRPHLRDYDPMGCDCDHVRPIGLGASNLWFPVIISALSVPQATDDLGRLIEENWTTLEKATSLDILKAFRSIGQLKDFTKYENDEELWDKIEARRRGEGFEEESLKDLKTPEWKVFSNPAKAQESRSFKLRSVDPPEEYHRFFEKIVLVEKLREVRAIVGFSRITSPRDFDTPADMPEERRATISRKKETWLPAAETRGEGIFFQFNEGLVEAWVKANHQYEHEFDRSHHEWLASKNITSGATFPGLRYVLLHSFSHALIRQLAVDCGYTSASLAERIYCRKPEDGEPMAGVLVYTSAADSEGTLGGLCSLGEPDKLGRNIRRAMEKVQLCSSDPLCSEHPVGSNNKLHGAACHACSFLPETSCEKGNRYLDRAVLVKSLDKSDKAFFEGNYLVAEKKTDQVKEKRQVEDGSIDLAELLNRKECIGDVLIRLSDAEAKSLGFKESSVRFRFLEPTDPMPPKNSIVIVRHAGTLAGNQSVPICCGKLNWTNQTQEGSNQETVRATIRIGSKSSQLVMPKTEWGKFRPLAIVVL